MKDYRWIGAEDWLKHLSAPSQWWRNWLSGPENCLFFRSSCLQLVIFEGGRWYQSSGSQLANALDSYIPHVSFCHRHFPKRASNLWLDLNASKDICSIVREFFLKVDRCILVIWSRTDDIYVSFKCHWPKCSSYCTWRTAEGPISWRKTPCALQKSVILTGDRRGSIYGNNNLCSPLLARFTATGNSCQQECSLSPHLSPWASASLLVGWILHTTTSCKQAVLPSPLPSSTSDLWRSPSDLLLHQNNYFELSRKGHCCISQSDFQGQWPPVQRVQSAAGANTMFNLTCRP